ncbi:Fic family protein [Leucobacter sp. GX0328]
MSEFATAGAWPPHGAEVLPWQQKARGGTREDRMLRSVEASIPPAIAELDYFPSPLTQAESERALIAVARAEADATADGHSAALSRFMIRSESVASSKIERISASAEDFARALAGGRGNSSATSMVAASRAMVGLIEEVGAAEKFSSDRILAAHRHLMEDDPYEAEYAGRVRDMQNWVGGSDYSPRGALHVPPRPERLAELFDDLVAYLNRDDVPVIVQAAIAHAQFESIHAFTDGNGRIGRALVSASMRRRGVTENVIVPLASGLLARREDYFDALTAYRVGDPGPIIHLFSVSARIAAEEARGAIARMAEIQQEWRSEYNPRAGSTGSALLEAFIDHPVMSAEAIEQVVGASDPARNAAISAMEAVGILREMTGRKRDRVWVASELLAELDELDRRIHKRMGTGAA